MTHSSNEDRHQQTVGDLLRACRRRAGRTQQETAVLAGLSVAALRDVEQGRVRTPRASTLRRLAGALALSPTETDELMGRARAGSSAGLRLNILGPMVVHLDGAPVDLGSDLQRSLLGLLALTPNASVGRDMLIEIGWGSQPPPRAANMLQTQISRLRHRLRAQKTGSTLLTATPGGYQLTVTRDQLDLLEFIRLVAAARDHRDDGDLSRARELFESATRLWRDDPLSDVPRLHAHPAVAEVTERWRDVVLDHARLADDPVSHRRVLPALERAARVDPFHEPTGAQLMIALAATGQQAAALGVFETMRRRLGDELGTSPGPELHRAHVRVLRQQVAQPPRAPLHAHRQLPPDIADFTGRRRELGALRDVVSTGTTGPWCVEGMPGAGKTRLAVHFAHQLLADGAYPDAQLFVDLHGHSPRPPADPAATLGSLLGLLGVDLTRIPQDLDARSALYRDRLRGRRVLVVLDNAASGEQVRPLLPPEGSLAIVTSRRSLALDGANTLTLDALTPDDAVAFLGKHATHGHRPVDPNTSRTVAELCGGLPLALKIVCSRLQARPTWTLSDLATRLRESVDQVVELSVGNRRLRTAFDLSFDALDPGAQRVFRHLGQLAGDTFTSRCLAGASGLPEHDVVAALDRLSGEHLVRRVAAGEFRIHRLLHEYARILAQPGQARP